MESVVGQSNEGLVGGAVATSEPDQSLCFQVFENVADEKGRTDLAFVVELHSESFILDGVEVVSPDDEEAEGLGVDSKRPNYFDVVLEEEKPRAILGEGQVACGWQLATYDFMEDVLVV